jgi:Ser/Thr protein kinase RdoA (MazF antagonist)
VSRRPIPTSTLHRAAWSFGLEPESLEFVRDVANVVYAAKPVRSSASEARFLRLTHRMDRSPPDVRAEIAWLRFLVEEELPVCRPLPAGDGSFSASADDDFTAVAFARVRGRPCELARFEGPVFERMGRFLGRLHRVTQTRYIPSEVEPQRLHWHALDDPARVLGSWAADDARLAARFEEVCDGLRGQPIAADRYGLIHGDINRGNLFLHAEGIDVLDFDDCCRAPLVMDIANALFYSLWDRRYAPEPERRSFASGFLAHLLRGYREERPCHASDLALVPAMLEFRELAVDAFSHRRHQNPDAETRRRWAHVRDRIRRGAPYVELA